MSVITIKTFLAPHEANICKSQLESEGTKCFIKNEAFIGINPLISIAAGGYQLQCNIKDSKKALEIINYVQPQET